MRLCVYTKTWRSSGSGLFAQELAHALAAEGAEVLFVAPCAEAERFRAPTPRLRRWTPPRELATSAPKLFRAVVSALRILCACALLLAARARARTFIVSIPDPLIFSVPVLMLLRASGARIVYVVHDPEPHAWRLPRALRGLERLGFDAAHGLASALVVLSEPSKAKLAARAPSRTPIAVIEHGVFALAEGSALPGLGRFLVFGTLRRNKGVREAIAGVVEARRRGGNASLIIAGEPDAMEPDYWRECEALARRHADCVSLRLGYVPDEALPGLLAETDAFLLPYRDFHSQSGVAILAASNARPVVAAAAGGIGALMREGLPSVEIAEPMDATAVAEAVLRFASVGAEEWRLRCAAYAMTMQTHRSWRKVAADYIRLVDASRSAAVTA